MYINETITLPAFILYLAPSFHSCIISAILTAHGRIAPKHLNSSASGTEPHSTTFS